MLKCVCRCGSFYVYVHEYLEVVFSERQLFRSQQLINDVKCGRRCVGVGVGVCV